MDLSQIKAEERVLTVVNPATGNPIGLAITLAPTDDDRLKRLRRKYADQAAHLQKRNKTLTAVEVEANIREMQVAATRGWRWYNPTGSEGDEGFDDQKHAHWKSDRSPQLTEENVKEVYENAAWIAIQVSEFLSDYEGFFKA